jgi:SAM-dependent methyltransferase
LIQDIDGFITSGAGLEVCPVCESDCLLQQPYVEGLGHKEFDDLDVMICQRCGHGWVDTVFAPSVLDHYYAEIYRSERSSAFFDYEKGVPNPVELRALGQMLLCRQFLSTQQNIKILDVGAGPGNSYLAAKRCFPESHVFFLEKSPKAAAYYQKHFDVVVIEDLTTLDQKFDLIIMSHSLEHFHSYDTRNFVLSLEEALADEGLLFIEVPNNDFRLPSHCNGVERLNDTPHLQFFSGDSLRKTVEGLCGLQVEYLNSSGRFLDSSMPVNITDLRDKAKVDVRTSDHSKIRAGFFGKALVLIRSTLAAIGVLDGVHLAYHFLVKNGFAHDEFSYGGNRHTLRVVARKCSPVKSESDLL